MYGMAGGCAPAVLVRPAAVVPCGVVFPLRHWFACRCGVRRGAEPRRYWLSLPLWCPAGGARGRSPANLAFSFPFCPLSPQPPSPVGKGENQSFLMQGAPPLASSGLAPRGTGSAGVSGALRGRTGDGRRLALPPHVPGGGVPFSSPANPAFSVVSAPYPPSPLPRRGRGSGG